MRIISNSIILVAILILITFTVNAQIYAPEGVNMPGDWDGWTNPPNNPVFAGDAQNSNGTVKLVSLGIPFYQTIFHVSDNGGDVTAGDYSFKFTSGPLDNIWQNQWGDVSVTFNTLQSYTYGVAGSEEPQPNTITLNNNRWYVANYENTGYEDTRAIFMEMSANPVDLLSVSRNPMMPLNSDNVTVTVTSSGSPSPEEKIYLRFTVDGWNTSQLSSFTFTGNEGTAIIPAYPDGTSVDYYVFSTVINNPQQDIDLVTIHYNTNNGDNYNYTVGDTLSCGSGLALISTEPPFPLDTSSVIITFNANLGNGGLSGYNDTVYIHTGVITSESVDSHDWKHVKTDWGENTLETMMTLIDSNLYQIYLPNIRTYYGLEPDEELLKLAFVFRSKGPSNNGNYLEGKTAEPDDIFVDVYKNELNVKITNPSKREPLVDPNTPLPICVAALKSDSITLMLDNQFLQTSQEENLFYALDPSSFTAGIHWIIATAFDSIGFVTDSVKIYIRGDVPIADLPGGVVSGINYINDSTVTLVLHDPAKHKRFAFVIGDFNGWDVDDNGYMNRTPEGDYFWITISGLTPNEEYAYQYYIDGELKLADPFCDKILDPYNDKWIPEDNYPALKIYPFDKTTGNVSVLQTAQQPYSWAVENFTPSAINETQSDLIIYELLIRDFVEDRRISSIIDTLDYLKNLGVNAIELMPFNEFEGNDSWGYNPDFYFAPDKAYGTKDDYKDFVDACHQKGIAVIMDIALNHSFGQSPMAQMYWDNQLNRPAADNPWYNQQAPHPLSPGSDFNHESPYTKAFCKRIFNYWMDEYKIDGFRLDLSKGFTQTYSGDDMATWSHYDQSRINILTDYYNSIKADNANAYVILEHFADNDEETVLANTGMLLWGRMTENFNQATMGYAENSDFSWAYYTDRGFTYPNLIPFMESHDEERLMFKNITYGNFSGSYNIKDTITSLQRIEAIAPLYYVVPGPKMLWQFEELGYDYSINFCSGDTINEQCRTWSKPVRWDYWQDGNRQKLYQVFAALAKLKQENVVFEQGVYTKDLGSLVKRAWIAHSTMNVVTGANFDVNSNTVNPGFQHTGTWYNYFTGESFNVNSTSGYSINTNPGEYYVFTDQKLIRPFVNLNFRVYYEATGDGAEGATVTLEKYGVRQTNQNGETSYTPASNSEYTYHVKLSNQIDTTGIVTVDETDQLINIVIKPNGVTEINAAGLQLYPNPVTAIVTLNTDNNFEVTITDISGKVWKKQPVEKGVSTIDISSLPTGLYLFYFENSSRILVKKVVKR